jgi:23S rRNA (guanosine2251-2'-O)-methyltransferase
MRKLHNDELNRLSTNEFKNSEKLPVYIVLDNIRSQHNIGSVFRTTDAFLLEGIYLCGITATPPHREIHKTALGATESVDWRYFPETREAITELKARGYRIYAIEQAENSIPLNMFELPADPKIALVFGNEINGVEEAIMEMVDDCIEIPQFGTKHSLNVAVSAGIVIWEIANLYRS